MPGLNVLPIRICCCFSVLSFGYGTTLILAQKLLLPLGDPSLHSTSRTCQVLSALYLKYTLHSSISSFLVQAFITSFLHCDTSLYTFPILSTISFPSSPLWTLWLTTQLLLKNFEIVPHCLRTKTLLPYLAFRVLPIIALTAFKIVLYPCHLSCILYY